MPTNMRAELLVDIGDRKAFTAVAADWIDAAANAVFPGAFGNPDIKASLIVVPASLSTRVANRRYGAKTLQWALEAVADGCQVNCPVARHGDRDHAYISVNQGEEGEGWAQLSVDFPEELFANDDPTARQQRLVSLLREFGERLDPVFGWIGFGGASDRTEFEFSMNSYGVFDEYPTARRYLRGYDWVTVIPKEIVARLGGIAALDASGAFTELTPTSSGAVTALATETFLDYGDTQARPVFEAVAKALRPGLPRARKHRPERTTPVMLEDAAKWGAYLD